MRLIPLKRLKQGDQIIHNNKLLKVTSVKEVKKDTIYGIVSLIEVTFENDSPSYTEVYDAWVYAIIANC